MLAVQPSHGRPHTDKLTCKLTGNLAIYYSEFGAQPIIGTVFVRI
jgi:hypothetical protein